MFCGRITSPFVSAMKIRRPFGSGVPQPNPGVFGDHETDWSITRTVRSPSCGMILQVFSNFPCFSLFCSHVSSLEATDTPGESRLVVPAKKKTWHVRVRVSSTISGRGRNRPMHSVKLTVRPWQHVFQPWNRFHPDFLGEGIVTATFGVWKILAKSGHTLRQRGEEKGPKWLFRLYSRTQLCGHCNKLWNKDPYCWWKKSCTTWNV